MTDTKPPRRPGDKSKRPAARTPHAEPAAPPREDARIAKVIARAGLCSRRDAETWIAAGRVAVNGTVIDSPALNVSPQDRITVDGQPLSGREKTRLFLYHKPRGVVTTSKDPEGRPTLFDQLPEDLPRVVSIGRLDINTEGLILLTNDGGLARVLELPSTGWLRRYRVRAKGEIRQEQLDQLAEGISIDGIDYAGIEARIDREQGANVWLTMGLREGKNREIKRVLEHLGLQVNRLIRLSFGPFQLGDLAEGAVDEIKTKVLSEQLGPTLAREAGVDFAERPAPEEVETGRAGPRMPRRGGPLPRPEPLAAPRPSRPKEAGPRAHVSVLRAQRAAEEAEGRKRIERASTQDRQGRAVVVERVTPVKPKPLAGVASRNARRFAREQTDESESMPVERKRAPAREAGTRPPRAQRPAERSEGAGERPLRRPRPVGEGAPRRAPVGDRPRAPRFGGAGEGGGERPRAPRVGGAGGERSGDRPRAPRVGGAGAERSGDRPRTPRFGGKGEGGAERPRTPRFGGTDEGRGDRPRAPRFGGAGEASGERPRTRFGGAGGQGRGDRPRAPGRAEDRTERFGRSPRPDRADRPGHPDRPDRPDRPGRSGPPKRDGDRPPRTRSPRLDGPGGGPGRRGPGGGGSGPARPPRRPPGGGRSGGGKGR